MALRFFSALVSGALFCTLATHASIATESLDDCHQVASRCLAAGSDRSSCQAQVDECMSKHACEIVYMSCLELMDVDEGLTEAACAKKRTLCRRKRRQG